MGGLEARVRGFWGARSLTGRPGDSTHLPRASRQWKRRVKSCAAIMGNMSAESAPAGDARTQREPTRQSLTRGSSAGPKGGMPTLRRTKIGMDKMEKTPRKVHWYKIGRMPLR